MLQGLRVLVTGGSGGIGGAVARRVAAAGGVPVLHCRRNRAAAEAVARDCGEPAAVVQADLRDEVEVEQMYAQVLAGGRLDAVVVNAGIWVEQSIPLQRMSLAQWQGTLDSDLTSAFLTCRGFFRHLEEQPRDEASVVLIGSTAGLFGEAGHADYAAAKAAMAHGLTASLKNEIVALARRGRVNCVCPGWVRTPMAAAALADPSAVAHATACVAMHKVAEPDDVAAAVTWLLSATASGHVSGVVLPVDGGMEGRLLHRP